MMACFSCIFGSYKKNIQKDGRSTNTSDTKVVPYNTTEEQRANNTGTLRFKFRELKAATENFKEENFLDEGGFGKVYKGRLPSTNEIVAIKRLNQKGYQGENEFLVETETLSKGQHENLVKLIGICSHGGEMLLVYEYLPLGSLENHLHDPQRHPLDWNTRMNIALGAARGLEYVHNTMKIIYRDMKCANILLGEGYHTKLSDFGLAKVGPTRPDTHVSTRIMGTDGYCAPEYRMTGKLRYKADIYSFGVVLLELITGRRAVDPRRASGQVRLVEWAIPFLNSKHFMKIVDPRLQGQYPVRYILQTMEIAKRCVNEDQSLRPESDDIVSALEYICSNPYHTPSVRINRGFC